MCNNGIFGNNSCCWWIIILLVLFFCCGNGNGCGASYNNGCDNNCGCC